jgi:transcriptional regulator with XRE-family HTH domain
LIGQRLRAVRLERGLSQEDAAARAKLSRSFISMVEAGSSEIALSRLIRLADAYGVLITELLVDMQEPHVELTKAAEQYRFPTGDPRVDLSYLSTPSWRIQPFSIRLAPGGRLESLSHAGEEFIHCVSGEAVMIVSGKERRLRPGDTLVIPGSADHTYLNPGKRPVHLVGGTMRVEPRPQSLAPANGRMGRT